MRGRIVIYAYVVGDILHKGHLLHLKNAKALGDILIVGVLTDEAVMEKKDRPVLDFAERLELVGSLKMVDVAIPQGTYSPVQNVWKVRPDILVESGSHEEGLVASGIECMKKIGGKVITLPYYPEQSSTAIKNRIIKNNKKS